MTEETAALLRDVLALDADQRAVVANALLKSLHGSEEASDLDDAWRAEVERRLDDVRSDAVELVDEDRDRRAAGDYPSADRCVVPGAVAAVGVRWWAGVPVRWGRWAAPRELWVGVHGELLDQVGDDVAGSGGSRWRV